MIVDLLRHGRTERDHIFRGSTDVPLSDLGWTQMQAACGEDRWGRVITSPLGRCLHFAQHVSDQSGANLSIESRLAEYDFGDWDGKTYDEVMQTSAIQINQFFTDPKSITPPNGEPFVNFQQRISAFWKMLTDLGASETDPPSVLVVAHGGVIISILGLVLEVEHLFGKIAMPYACRSRIQIDKDGRSSLVYHR